MTTRRTTNVSTTEKGGRPTGRGQSLLGTKTDSAYQLELPEDSAKRWMSQAHYQAMQSSKVAHGGYLLDTKTQALPQQRSSSHKIFNVKAPAEKGIGALSAIAATLNEDSHVRQSSITGSQSGINT